MRLTRASFFIACSLLRFSWSYCLCENSTLAGISKSISPCELVVRRVAEYNEQIEHERAKANYSGNRTRTNEN